MPRENAKGKAGRLLLAGCVQVLRLDQRGCLAQVRGDTGFMRTVRFEHDRWTCDCPALSYCSHAIAVARVVVVKHGASSWTRCRAKATTVDHVLARAFGGTNAPSNPMSLCRVCAAVKSSIGERRAMPLRQRRRIAMTSSFGRPDS